MSNPRVFTIPASVPFLRTLIEALVAGELVPDFNASDPLAFASATIYLPTHRAVRIARDVFLDVLRKDAAILPRMAAIGDLDDDEIAFAEMATGTLAEDALSLAEALGGFERKMLLAQLILKWAASPQVRGPAGSPLVAGNPATALALPGWQTIAIEHYPILAGIALTGAIGQWGITVAFKHAPAASVAPLEYTGLAWVILIDFAVWSAVPGLRTLMGAALIIASGIYLLRFEARRVPGPA